MVTLSGGAGLGVRTDGWRPLVTRSVDTGEGVRTDCWLSVDWVDRWRVLTPDSS